MECRKEVWLIHFNYAFGPNSSELIRDPENFYMHVSNAFQDGKFLNVLRKCLDSYISFFYFFFSVQSDLAAGLGSFLTTLEIF